MSHIMQIGLSYPLVIVLRTNQHKINYSASQIPWIGNSTSDVTLPIKDFNAIRTLFHFRLRTQDFKSILVEFKF